MDATQRRRVETLLAVAEAHATGVPVGELPGLVPGAPAGLGDAGPVQVPGTEWTEAGGRLYRTPDLAARHDPERHERGMRFLHVAEDLIDRTLGKVQGLVRTIAVTGSVAFGEPRAGDDCDFLVITRDGAVWPFLLFAYIAVRRRRREVGAPDEPSTWCFNYVLAEAAAERAFARPSGFQFAREALTVRPLRGEGYYRELLGRSPWMREEAPGLYDRWTLRATSEARPRARPRAALAVRLANWAIYPVLATYLQLVTLRDNARLRSKGSPEKEFEIVTEPDRLEVRSLKFARLAALYE